MKPNEDGEQERSIPSGMNTIIPPLPTVARATAITAIRYRLKIIGLYSSIAMTDVKAFLYEICIPAIGALCFLAAVLNIAVFISRFHVKSRSATLELTYSLALSDTWTSLVIAISLCWNSYKPVVLQIPHNSYCFPLTLETLPAQIAANNPCFISKQYYMAEDAKLKCHG
ncbi:hypothetical protein TELCIR_11166, partial [Teladorsagia circumcincta]